MSQDEKQVWLINKILAMKEDRRQLQARIDEIGRTIVDLQAECTHLYANGRWAGGLDFNPNHSCRICGGWVPARRTEEQ